MYEISSKLARKIIIFSPINEWHAIAFASPHTFTNVGYVKNKGVVKFSLSDLFFLGSVSEIMKKG